MSAFLSDAFANAAMPMAQLSEVLRRSMRRLPTSADGLTDAQAAPNVENRVDEASALMRMVRGFNGQLRRGNPLPPAALPSLLDAILHAKLTGLDDRKLLLEHILSLLSRLPPSPPPSSREWSLQSQIQNAVIGLFYDALPHPPTTFVSSMMLETRLPTFIGDQRVGAGGGVSVSEGAVGRTRVGGVESSSANVGGNSGEGLGIPTPAPTRMGSEVNSDTPASWGATSPAGINTVTPTTSNPPSQFLTNGNANPDGTSPQQQPQPPQPTTTNSVPQKAYPSIFRTPSGAGNNPHLPLLGAAGTAYARNVVPQHPIPPHTLPDPGMVFDLLMRRRPPPPGAHPNPPSSSGVDPKLVKEFRGQGHGLPHPSGLSSLLFAFGDLIIHSLFRTSARDDGVNLTSSYLDLSVLYGVDELEMSTVRRYDGTGRLWEDCWADPRIAMMSPAVGALLVIFCRNHNYVALRLLEINERRMYEAPAVPPKKTNAGGPTSEQMFPLTATPPPPSTISAPPNPLAPPLPSPAEKLRKQDDDIFNRARLINCAYFMNAILGDYLAGILGTFREASEWYLNPLEDVREGGVTKVPRAEGNCVSVEFNLLYRWHSTLTPSDERWLEGALKANLPATHPVHQMESGKVELAKSDFREAAMNAGRKQGTIPKAWTFGGLQRTPTGAYKDHELAKILHNATDTVACAYGARGIPAVMRVVEIMGIEQARKWGVCTMNEFRQFVGLKKYESFKEWNPTGDIAEVAEQLYQHIDNLELYVGLMCEESKQPGDGAGLCPGYTISRAILADAVCLTRGDRFLTTDLTPANLTAWGYQDCARDTKNGSMGGNVCKLLFRNLPQYYPERSVYAHFPFVTPNEMEHWLTEMNLRDKYVFTPLSSEPIRPIVSVNSAKGVSRVLNDMSTFHTIYSDGMKYLTNNHGFFLCFDQDPQHRLERTMISKALYRDGAMERYTDIYRATTRDLIVRRSFSSGTNKRAVNIVRDVLNIVPVHWVCEEIAGIPLKSEEAPRGIFTEQETYGMLACMFTFIFLNIEPENGWILREKSLEFSKVLLGFIKGRLEKVSGEGSIFSLRGLRDSILHYMTEEIDNSDGFYRALIANNSSGLTLDQLSYNVLGLITGSTANIAMACTLVVDFYLDDNRAQEKAEMVSLSMDNTPEASRRLAGYVREALRLHPQAPGIFREAMADLTIVEGNGLPPVNVQNGDRIFVSLAKANVDPEVIPNPEVIDPTRPREQYSSFGRGEHTCLGDLFTDAMIPAVMRSVFSLKNLRRGPNYTGVLNKFKHDIFGTEADLYISNKGTVSPFPASLLIEYDI